MVLNTVIKKVYVIDYQNTYLNRNMIYCLVQQNAKILNYKSPLKNSDSPKVYFKVEV